MKVLKILLLIFFVFSCTKKEVTTLSPKQIRKIRSKLIHFNRYARVEGAEAAAAVGPLGIEFIKELTVNLKHPDPMVKRYSAFAIGSIGPKANKAVKELVLLLKDKNAEVVQNAAWAINKIGGEKEFYKFLKDQVKVIEDKTSYYKRAETARMYGRLGAYGELAVSVLGERLIYDEHPSVRQAAAEALGMIGSGEAIPYLHFVHGNFFNDIRNFVYVDSENLFGFSRIPFAIFKLDVGDGTGSMQNVLDGASTTQKITEVKDSVYSKFLFVKASHLYFRNSFKNYIPLFNDGKLMKYKPTIYIKHTHDEEYSRLPRELFPTIMSGYNPYDPGRRVEKSPFVREAIKKAYEKIGGGQ